MNVLSLFDGISCGQIALERVGIKVDNYFASEIDKHTIKVTQSNYPNTIQLGNIKTINLDELPKIDLIFAGFPCQSWSFAGKMDGDKDPRGSLVYDLIYTWKKLSSINPNLKFLFENVLMKKEFIDQINSLFGLEPIKINSNLVSAQNRRRLYWTNIKNINQPTDRYIHLKDILELDLKDVLTDEYIQKKKKQKRWGNSFGTIETKKHPCLCAIGKSDVILFEDLKRFITPLECERLQTIPDNYTNSICMTRRYSAIGNGWTIDVISHILKNIFL